MGLIITIAWGLIILLLVIVAILSIRGLFV